MSDDEYENEGDFDQDEVDDDRLNNVDESNALNSDTDDENFEDENGWVRIPVPMAQTAETALVMQCMDIDFYLGKPLPVNPSGKETIGYKKDTVGILRMFGVTPKGNSVCAHVHGFTHYMYCESPKNSITPAECASFLHELNRSVSAKYPWTKQTPVIAVVPVYAQTIMHYSFGKQATFLKIYVSEPRFQSSVREVLISGVFCIQGKYSYQTYESNMAFTMRYMIDNSIVGGNWLEMPGGTYSVRPRERRASRCQIEVDIFYTEIKSHESVGKWSKLAPLRIMSFDIECCGRIGHFPDPKHDAVIQIAVNLSVQGRKEGGTDEDEFASFAVEDRKRVFVLGSCEPIEGVEVVCFEEERLMLEAFARLVRACDPDIITGYNIQNFDGPYLLNRAAMLQSKQFTLLGRLRGVHSKLNTSVFESSAFGKRKSSEINYDGRVMMDVIQFMYRNHKLSSYSLNSVSAEFLDQQKEDVHYTMISVLHNGSAADRKRLAVYCVKDAVLPQLLMDKLLIVINYVEMARVTGVPVSYLFSRGQQIKVLSMIYRKTRDLHLLIPHIVRPKGPPPTDVGYEGATVLPPKQGFYKVPIATLDFASLYPSIMQAHNLCYSTLIQPHDVGRLHESDYEKTPTGHYFMRGDKCKGILPMILTELLAARSKAKKDMNAATDPLEKAVMNGRQLALKVSANSVYGFTGATIGALPCIAISASVTSFGRQMIEATKNYVEQNYPHTEVVYGDTDSVMVKFGVETVAEALALGREAAKRVTKSLFVSPISLEFEKVYCPYLLLNKKRYAGLYWTKPEKFDKLDVKGLENARRDNCALVRNTMTTCLEHIIIRQDIPTAVKHVQNTIADLLMNKIDISWLVITKSLSTDADQYKSKQVHAELAERMRKRDPGSAPVSGDRVPFVYITAAKNTPAYEKGEHPLYVMENNIPLDNLYYLENQLKKPMQRLFEHLIPNTRILFEGEHTLRVTKVTPSNNKGLMRFAVKKFTCMKCQAVLPDSHATCTACEKHLPKLLLDSQERAQEKETEYTKLLKQCSDCQGNMYEEVICSNADCEIFYKRLQVKKDLVKVKDTLARFTF
jgi:DNA polymerase delta subunit 1